MFSFLLVFGLSILVLGLYIERTGKSYFSEKDVDMKEIIRRIVNIESVLYGNNTIVSSGEEFDFIDDFSFEDKLYEDTLYEDDVKTISPDTRPEKPMEEKKDTSEVISLLKSGKYTLEEACEILGMQKGEVLLLKNLSKK